MRNLLFASILSFNVFSVGIAQETEDETIALKALIGLTHDEDAEIRALAFEALPEVSIDADGVTMSILAGTTDKDARVRLAALKALLDVSDDSEVIANALMTAFEDPEDEIAKWAGKHIVKMGPAVVKQLATHLKKVKTRLRALDLLGDIGPGAKEVVPDVIELAKSKDANVPAAVITCLVQICSKGPKLSTLDSRLRSYLETTFSRYDSNADGELTANEVEAMRTKPDGADADLNGKLSRREYERWFAKKYAGRLNSPEPRPAPLPVDRLRPPGERGGR